MGFSCVLQWRHFVVFINSIVALMQRIHFSHIMAVYFGHVVYFCTCSDNNRLMHFIIDSFALHAITTFLVSQFNFSVFNYAFALALLYEYFTNFLK